MSNKKSKIKQKVREYSYYKGFTRSYFNSLINVSESFLKSDGGFNVDFLPTIRQKCPDLNIDWLLFDEGEMILDTETVNKVESGYEVNKRSKKLIPLIPIEAVAGLGSGDFEIQDKDIIDGYQIPDFERKGVEYIIRVSGSSMSPKYSNGDLLGCKRITDTTFFQWGKPYVLDTNQGVMVKRLFPVDENSEALICHSDNKENYPPFVINKSSIYKISIVIGVLRME
jgi:repressor LexA